MMQAGAPHGITPFGVEALMALRIEKGFLHVGSDTDGTTMPQDVGFGATVAKKPDDFIGRRSTMTPEGLRRSEEHTSELQSLMRISYAVLCLKNKKNNDNNNNK